MKTTHQKPDLTTALSINQVYKVWSTDPDLLKVIDLRGDQEYRKCHIPGALNLHKSQVNLDVFKSEPEKLFVVVTGEQENICSWIQEHNIENVVCLKGGIDDWCNEGHPLFGKTEQFIDLLTKQQGQKKDLNQNLIFNQLFEPETSTYTYLLADRISKEAIIIDPVLEAVDRDLKLISELGLKLVYILDTHVHADHITGADELRARTGAKIALSALAAAQGVDIQLQEGQELKFGDLTISAIETPGHTDGCMSFYCQGRVFTGDSLMIRGAGRTDFQQGSADKLYESITEKLFKLPPETLIYPAHDYRGMSSSCIEAEIRLNPRIGGGRSKDEFKKIMSELKLSQPKKIHIAVPANLECGKRKSEQIFTPLVVNDIPEISAEDLQLHLEKALAAGVRIIDVRRPEEFNDNFGHIQGAELVTLGPDLESFLAQQDKNKEYVFICRSSGRSAQATARARNLGFTFTRNMIGGMIVWNELKFKTVRN